MGYLVRKFLAFSIKVNIYLLKEQLLKVQFEKLNELAEVAEFVSNLSIFSLFSSPNRDISKIKFETVKSFT